MKARILPLDSDEHRTTQELLPWFVNETLDPDEAEQVATHLARCARCQADAAAQAALRSAPLGEAAGGDVERDWATLRGRLGPSPEAFAARPLPARSWWQRGLPVAVAIQAVVVAVLAVALTGVLTRPAPYRTLGASASSAEANALAVFRPDATEQEIRTALRSAGARIVGGPTVTDAYLLHLGRLDAAALAGLRAQPGVLRVESLQGEAAR